MGIEQEYPNRRAATNDHGFRVHQPHTQTNPSQDEESGSTSLRAPVDPPAAAPGLQRARTATTPGTAATSSSKMLPVATAGDARAWRSSASSVSHDSKACRLIGGDESAASSAGSAWGAACTAQVAWGERQSASRAPRALANASGSLPELHAAHKASARAGVSLRWKLAASARVDSYGTSMSSARLPPRICSILCQQRGQKRSSEWKTAHESHQRDAWTGLRHVCEGCNANGGLESLSTRKGTRSSRTTRQHLASDPAVPACSGTAPALCLPPPPRSGVRRKQLRAVWLHLQAFQARGAGQPCGFCLAPVLPASLRPHRRSAEAVLTQRGAARGACCGWGGSGWK
jgi:hypothetical protein